MGPGLGDPIGSTGGPGGPIGDSGCPLCDPHVPPPSSVLLPRPRHRRGHGDRLPRGPRGGFRAERGPIRHPRRRRVSTGAKKPQNPIFSPQKIPLFQPKKNPNPVGSWWARRSKIRGPFSSAGPELGGARRWKSPVRTPDPPQKKGYFGIFWVPEGLNPCFCRVAERGQRVHGVDAGRGGQRGPGGYRKGGVWGDFAPNWSILG